MVLKKIIFLLCVPFALVYFLCVALRNFLYSVNVFRRHRINAKVISVGNITWGGTGKTPVVAFIADMLAKKGRRVSILIRGYGNDEKELLPKLTSNVPVLVGKDRVKSGRDAIECHLSDTIIMDDGFQYRRLERDLDIVCVDASRPFGNGWVIPAGSLREGRGSLKRADIFLITKADLAPNKEKIEKLEKRLKKINPDAMIAKAIHRPLYFYRLLTCPTSQVAVGNLRSWTEVAEEKVNIGELQNKEIVLVSAIGSPECFEKTIQRLGLKINKHFIFRDHHAYTKEDVSRIEDYCRKNSLITAVTTEKDAVKLKSFQLPAPYPCGTGSAFSFQLLVLKVRLEIIENEDGFSDRLFGVCNS
ncbi:MAG: tetraacyldisaccharide 4'-kinase [Candidatus Omnitrophota bacterium]|nr:tetraacyldisaccharide 4'-kinase [Candidatus Omnitrophota bacterium]